MRQTTVETQRWNRLLCLAYCARFSPCLCSLSESEEVHNGSTSKYHTEELQNSLDNRESVHRGPVAPKETLGNGDFLDNIKRSV